MVGGFRESGEALVSAVLAHQDEEPTELPEFLEELQLPTEAKLQAELAEVEARLEEFRGRRAGLMRHKHLLTSISNSAFERLSIDELNLVLEGSGLEARDTIEQFIEDFEIVGEDVRIVAEAKAVGRNVGYANIDQLHHHRAAVVNSDDESEPGPPPTDIPGLLVANTFRNDQTLDRRRHEAIHSDTIRYARQMNVLILRSWDLYSLVARRLGGVDDAQSIAQSLQAGGGWLRVDAEGLELRRS